MTVTSGFFDSISSDRLYNSLQMSSIFDGIIEDGVFASIGEHLMVTAVSGMTVEVGSGRAWFDHTWTYNDGAFELTHDPADALLSRLDVVVLEVNREVGVRSNSFKIVKGANASSPVRPALTNAGNVHQYALAVVLIGPAVTSINQSNITNIVGMAETPFVTGPLSVISTNDLLVQWETEFGLWFDSMKDQLTTDAAGNLQTQIYNIVGNASPPLITLLTLKTHNHTSGNGNQIPNGGIADGAVGTTKLANDSVDDTKVGARVPQVYRRSGSLANDWTAPGATTFTPGAVRMQLGSYLVGPGAGTTVINFPVAFSGKPLVFLTSDSSQAAVALVQVNTTNFSFSNQAASTGITVNWFAIGPE